jgi:hypothetical protein
MLSIVDTALAIRSSPKRVLHAHTATDTVDVFVFALVVRDTRSVSTASCLSTSFAPDDISTRSIGNPAADGPTYSR